MFTSKNLAPFVVGVLVGVVVVPRVRAKLGK